MEAHVTTTAVMNPPNRQNARATGFLFVAGVVLFALNAVSASARGAPDSFADLAERLSPAVVNITTQTVVAGSESGPSPIVPEGSPLEDFFKDFLDRRRDGDRTPRRSSALGSGFIISADGFIVTNNHVIEKADEITIELFEGGELDAKLIGRDPKTDIALLKVESDDPLPFVEFGDSDLARVGDWVMAIGNPLGQGFSVSAGIVSARNRALRGSYDDFIQTDAAINRGNSGGPLFNMDGEVIGVNTAILSPNGGSIGIGFSMSSAVVKNVVNQLQQFGQTRRGWLGVRIQDVTDDMAEAIGLASADGAMVTEVPDGPAKDGGVLAGDVITSFDGKDVENVRELVRIVGDTDAEKSVRVVVFRNGGTQTLKVTIGLLEEEVAVNASVKTTEPEPALKDMVGMTFSSITDEARKTFSLAKDAEGVVVVNVKEDSEAYEKGMRAGDLIVEIAQEAVKSPSDLVDRFKAASEAGRRSILLLVRREGQPRFVALSPAG